MVINVEKNEHLFMVIWVMVYYCFTHMKNHSYTEKKTHIGHHFPSRPARVFAGRRAS